MSRYGPVDVLVLRGTGEPYLPGRVSGMSSFVTRELPATAFRSYDVDYPASIGPVNPQSNPFGVSEQDSIEIGIVNTVAMIRATRNLVGLVGYSLGAMVITRLLERVARGEYPELEILFAALIANPLRNAGDALGPAPGYGIAGGHRPWPPGITVWEAANPYDGICCCPPDSPIRHLPDVIEPFSFADLGGWNQQLIEKFQHDGWQATVDWRNPVEAWALYGNAIQLVGGYMAPYPHGQHTGYAHFHPAYRRDMTYCGDLARRIRMLNGV